MLRPQAKLSVLVTCAAVLLALSFSAVLRVPNPPYPWLSRPPRRERASAPVLGVRRAGRPSGCSGGRSARVCLVKRARCGPR